MIDCYEGVLVIFVLINLQRLNLGGKERNHFFIFFNLLFLFLRLSMCDLSFDF